MNEKSEHYEEKANQAITFANNGNSPEAVAFWVGSAQVAATLALVGAVEELTEAVKAGRA